MDWSLKFLVFIAFIKFINLINGSWYSHHIFWCKYYNCALQCCTVQYCNAQVVVQALKNVVRVSTHLTNTPYNLYLFFKTQHILLLLLLFKNTIKCNTHPYMHEIINIKMKCRHGRTDYYNMQMDTLMQLKCK